MAPVPVSLVVTLLPYSRCLSFSNLPHISPVSNAVPPRVTMARVGVVQSQVYTRGAEC